MGLGKLFGRSSTSGSTSSITSSRSRGLDSPRFGPGSSKADDTYGLNQSTSPISPISPGLAHGYYHTGEDVPPAYSQQGNSGFNDFATDSKMPGPGKAQTSAFGFPNPLSSGSREDNYAILKKYDIVVILDDSHSMIIADNPYGKSRWEQAWDALQNLVLKAIEYKTEGVRVCFLNRRDDVTITNREGLEELRRWAPAPQPGTYTPTGQVLDQLLCDYKKETKTSPTLSRTKKRIFLVVTDGAASDDPEDAIVDAAKFYQKNHFPLDQVGIQFVQVGNDMEAKKWLEDLDTNIKEGMGDYGRDIVDTIKSNGTDLIGDALLKALTGAVNRKLDRAGES